MKFLKMQAAGNDYIYVSGEENRGADYPSLAKKLCDRRFGVGADGIIAVYRDETKKCDFFMRIFNADGSEGKTCGNGLRCSAAFMRIIGKTTKETVAVRTVSACHTVRLSSSENGFFARADFPLPKIVPISKIADNALKKLFKNCDGATYAAVDAGNPHLVVFGAEKSAAEVFSGADIPNIFNDGINLESAKIGSDGICCDVFERGSGTTFSCGSGAVSTAFAAKKLLGFNLKKYPIFMRGGTLFVEFDNEKAYLSSEVTPVFTGETI